MSRSGITTAILIGMAAAAPAWAQEPSPSVPPPPPPGRVGTPALEGPTTELQPIPADDQAAEGRAVRDEEPAVSSHDALAAPGSSVARATRAYAPKPPPAAIAERPAGARPQPRARWIPGYWDWDPGRSEFFWMGGVWQVPPADLIWVGSRWSRDQNGWFRSPGFWSRRRDQVAVPTGFNKEGQPAWRTTGPPADHPADQPAAAPGPDYFFVPGHYAPAGDQLAWKAGFWARSQVGWDWAPARWVHRAAGWEFRAGHWVAEPDAADVSVRITARPPFRAPAADAGEAPPPPPGTEDEIDPIAEAERRERRDSGTVVVVPRNRMPYYMIRPPGMYGPAGIVVPGTVPGFVRDILDRVLP